jgi:CDP-4-dehydro-6-deoxyglucose reductase
MQLQFHLRRQEGTPFLDRLFSELKFGDTVELEGPFGDVTLDDDARRPLLMLAVGEEFAAIKSLIEHAINLDIREPVRLFWLADDTTGHYLENHCRSWHEVLDDYRFVPLTTAGVVPDAKEIGRLIEAIRDEVAELAAVDTYVAGPPQFQLDMQEQLLRRGADSARLFLPHHPGLRPATAESGG